MGRKRSVRVAGTLRGLLQSVIRDGELGWEECSRQGAQREGMEMGRGRALSGEREELARSPHAAHWKGREVTLKEEAGFLPGPRLPPHQKGCGCSPIGGFAPPGAGRNLDHLSYPLFSEGP